MTAVEWLMQNIEKALPNFIEAWRVEYEQAKEMEKQQMKDVLFEKTLRPFQFNFEQYYSKKYGK